jgi:peptidoglycan/xylan/chitin deacetylase (PgdA/CDA1 family)
MPLAMRLLALGALLGAGPALSQPPVREMAVTFDDLPVASRGLDLEQRTRLTHLLVDGLRAGRIPAVGFVNERQLGPRRAPDPGQAALLDYWLNAGLELGNHTYAHLDLHRSSLRDYERDVLDGEWALRPMLARRGARPRWFRHPFLHTGTSLAVRDSLQAFLAAHGYQVAPVTLDNYDYLFAAAYDRARDASARERIAAAYLDYMQRVVAYYEQQSTALFGRNLRQVLLVHASRLNADHFGQLAMRLRQRGYAFVPLERALQDPAYASPDRYAGPSGITWLHRWALTRGLRGAFFAGEPEVPAWVQRAAQSP